jgi:hypothetical protein
MSTKWTPPKTAALIAIREFFYRLVGSLVIMRIILTLMLILAFGCAVSQELSDDSFYQGLLLSNLQETPSTAHIRITRIEKNKEIYTESGRLGYIVFKVQADVIETFKGNKHMAIDYSIFREAPSEGPLIGEEFIVSLHRSEKGEYYIPDNGYELPATEALKRLARSASR